MNGYGWQLKKKVTVPKNGGTVVVALPASEVRENLTIWASSGDRPVDDLDFQLQINGVNFGASVTFNPASPAKMAIVVYQAHDSNGSIVFPTTGGPYDPPDTNPALRLDRFELGLEITNNVVLLDQDVTIYAAAIGRAGG